MKKTVWITYLGFICLLFIGMTYKVGFNAIMFIIWLAFSLVFAIPFYFQAQRESQPSSTEKIAARIWLYFRRFIFLIGVLLIAVAGINVLFHKELSLIEKTGLLIGCVIVSAIAIRIGWFGTKANTYGGGEQSLDEFKRTHEKRKRRYFW